jgi:hypothetical protein
MHWQLVVQLDPILRIIYFGDPYGIGLDSPMFTRYGMVKGAVLLHMY